MSLIVFVFLLSLFYHQRSLQSYRLSKLLCSPVPPYDRHFFSFKYHFILFEKKKHSQPVKEPIKSVNWLPLTYSFPFRHVRVFIMNTGIRHWTWFCSLLYNSTDISIVNCSTKHNNSCPSQEHLKQHWHLHCKLFDSTWHLLCQRGTLTTALASPL